MSFGYIGFNNMNMYGLANYNMFSACCNPFNRRAVANMVYNPFMMFNTARELINGNFPVFNFGYNNFACSPMSFCYPTMSFFSLPPLGSYPTVNGSLYDNLYSSQPFGIQVPQVNSYSTLASNNQQNYQVESAQDLLFRTIDAQLSEAISSNKSLTTRTVTQSEQVLANEEVVPTEPMAEAEKSTPKYKPIYEQIAGAHLNKAFLNKTKQVANAIGCDYEDLLAVMNSESTLNPKSEHKNKYGEVTAVGLIQFTKDYAIPDLNRTFGLNLSVEKIKNMSALDQLDLVQKYYEMNKSKLPKGKKITAADLYAVTYLPARASRDVLCHKGEDYYSSNVGLDMNRDNKITKDDLEQRLSQKRVKLSTFA